MLFWLVGYVGLYLTKLVLVLATFYTTLKSNPKSQYLIYTKYMGLNLAQVAMLAYGNYIYFSAGHG